MSNDRISAAEQGDPIDVTPPVWAASPDAPEEDDGHRPPMSRRRKIVLGSLAVVVLGGILGVGIWGAGIISQQDTKMSTPTTVAGLTKDNSSEAEATAEDLRAAFAAGIDLKSSVSAVYTDPAGANRSVLFFGGTALLWSPAKDLDTLFTLMGDESGEVSGVHEVDAGDLGGVMKCGTTPVDDGGTMAVCGWADHGATGMALFPSRAPEEAGKLMREMRGAVQTRD
jgi:hypothetical protein